MAKGVPVDDHYGSRSALNHDLPQRIPLHLRSPDVPYRPTTLARAALVIRVAAGLADWSDRDREIQQREEAR